MERKEKHISDWEDLLPYGICALTGERDGYCMGRILCDLSHKGAGIIRKFFGLPANCLLDSNWNSKVNGELAVHSIMIPASMFSSLAAFCVLESKEFPYVYVMKGKVYADTGYQHILIEQAWDDAMTKNNGDYTKARDSVPDYYRSVQVLRSGNNFNTHAMSGRA